MKNILFISGSLGLGHISRDLAIVNKLRELNPDVQVSWLADYPATLMLEQAGEDLLPEAKMIAHGNKELDDNARNHAANLTRWVMNMRKNWSRNAKIIFRQIIIISYFTNRITTAINTIRILCKSLLFVYHNFYLPNNNPIKLKR